LISILTFDGHAINDGTNYDAWFDVGDSPYSRQITPVIQRPLSRIPRYMRRDIQERIIPVHVSIKTDLAANREQLEEWFAPGEAGELVVAYEGTDRALTCVVTRFISYDGSANRFTAVLLAADPEWHSPSVQNVSQQQTASGATWDVTNDGNAVESRAVITLQPRTAKVAADAYLYKREVIVANRVARAFANYALDVTDSGLDHAALVTATKSQADGDDVRVRVDGVEVPRWFHEHASHDANSAATRVWINISLSPGKFAELLADVTAGTPADGSDLEVVRGGTSGWPRSGAFLIDDEIVEYDGVSESNANGRASFLNIKRARRGTAAASHSAGDILYWVERRVQIVYGWSAATAPDAFPERKPMLDFTSSTLTNEQHEYLDFAHETDPRSMQWARTYLSRDDQGQLVRAPSGTPAAAMTLEYDQDGASVGYPNYNAWTRDFPSKTDGNIAITRVVDNTMALQVIGTDEEGNEVRGTPANNGLLLGPLSSGSVNHDPGDVVSLLFWGVNQLIGASRAVALAAGTAALLDTDSAANAQQFTTGDEPMMLKSVSVWAGGSNESTTLRIMPDNAGAPAGEAASLGSASLNLSTTAGIATATFTTAIRLEPNTTYWIGIETGAGNSWHYTNGSYSGGPARINGTNYAYRRYEFKITGYPAPPSIAYERFDSNCLADDQDVAQVTALTVPLLATGVPYVAVGSEQAAYWLNGTLTNTLTAQSVTFDLICALLDEIEIDVGARTILNVTQGESVFASAQFSDPENWIDIFSGANTFSYDEEGIARVDVTISFRDRWH